MNPELHKITTFDGQEFVLNNNDDKVIISVTPGDWGLPNIDWQTRKAYQQYGESAVNFNFRARTLRLDFLSKACDRPDLFARRKELLNFLHPRRGGDLTYTFIREDLTKRAIRGRATGPGFSATDETLWTELSIDDPITIECFDPIWFDPDCNEPSVGAQITSDELVFPIVFPIVFQTGTVAYQFSVTYEGTWFAYPVFQITGPCSSFLIEHVTLGKFIRFARAVAAGTTLTLDLWAQTLTNSTTQADEWKYLGSDSDLVDFVIEHDPVVGSGLNQFEVQLNDATSDSGLVLQYNDRYVGI